VVLFFVFSPDKRLIIKTVPSSEYRTMESLLPDYYNHLISYPQSLLIRLLGTCAVTFGSTTVYVLIMANLFIKPIKNKFDLKGSWVDRTGEENSSVKKDNDLPSDFVLPMEPQNIATTLIQLELDTKLLKDHNIMDYSLLLGLGDECLQPINSLKEISSEIDDPFAPPDTSNSSLSTHIYPNTNNTHFIFGIIDILQTYNFSKKRRKFSKGLW